MENKELKVLIIEDETFCTDLFKSAFGQQHQILTADTAIKGLQSYRENTPDIVFLDIGLPDMSGLDVLNKIKEMNAKAYVVILSGMNTQEYIDKAKELGAAGFLTKPYNKEYIEHYIGIYKAE